MPYISCKIEPYEKAEFNKVLGFYGETQAFLYGCIQAVICNDQSKTIAQLVEEAQDAAGQR